VPLCPGGLLAFTGVVSFRAAFPELLVQNLASWPLCGGAAGAGRPVGRGIPDPAASSSIVSVAPVRVAWMSAMDIPVACIRLTATSWSR
jgi:hypothetical protein